VGEAVASRWEISGTIVRLASNRSFAYDWRLSAGLATRL
jgi:hypothetical protein